MYKGEISLALFRIFGAWPSTNTKGWLTIYNVYTLFIIFILVVFLVSNSFSILKENAEMNDCTENILLTCGVLTAFLKMLIIHWNHNRIQGIIKRLDGEQFVPRDSKELSIQSTFDKIGRFLFKMLVNTRVIKNFQMSKLSLV